MTEGRKKVLVITYYFPPSGGAGVQRTLKFVKYLREFGYEPVVLTAANADYPAYDESLLQEVPADIKVYRSRILEPYRIYRKFTGKQMDESTDIATLTLDERARRSLRERFSEWVRATFFVPDARIAWLFFALPMGYKIVRKENIRLLYSSAPPYTTHLIGLFLRRLTRIPWVADFRDSWIGWLSTPQWRPGFSRRLEMWMEESVLRYADRILAVSRGVKEDLLSRHRHLRDERWQLLPNGYDAQDFADVRPAVRDERLTVTYTGSLYGNRNPESLLRALENLFKTDPALPHKLRIRFVGRVGEPILRRIKESPVHEMIEHVPYVTHKESLAYLLSGDISLLIIDDAPVNRGILTGKLFEYIGAGLPILALAPEGDAAQLIREHGLGYVVHPKDVAGIQKILLEILENKDQIKKRRKATGDAVRRRFERKHLTGQLAAIFDELIEEKDA